jgi:hypothetical protein
VGGVLGVVVGAGVEVAAGTSGVGCELVNAASGVGENAVAGPSAVGAVGDDGTMGGPSDGVSAFDRVRSIVALPVPAVDGDGVEGMPVPAGDRGARTDWGGTMVASRYPGPASFGAAMTNGARATTTTKPMTIPRPV